MRCCCCCCFSDLLQVRSCSLQLGLQERQHWADLEAGEDLSPNSWKALPSLCCDPGYPCEKGSQLFQPRLGVSYGKIKLGVSRGLSEPNPSFVWFSVPWLCFSLNMKQLLCFTRPWKQTLITRHSVGCPYPLVHLVKGRCNIWCGPKTLGNLT